MAYTSKYGSYRGRGNGGKMVLAMVLIAIIVGCTVYLVTSGDIAWPDISFPTFERPEEEAEAPTQELDITVEVEEPVEPPKVDTHARLLSSDGTTWAEQDLTDFNAIVIPMKEVDGKVNYPSSVGSDSTLASANEGFLTDLLGQDIHAVAQITTLLDSTYALNHVEAAGLKNTGGYIFYDGYGKNWLDPAKEGTQTYLIAIVEELVALGFDEILLTELTYPTYGKVEKIAATADPMSDGLLDLVVALHTALDGTDVTLSIEISSEALVSGAIPYTSLAPYVSRFFVTPEDADTVDVILGAEAELVVMTTQPLSEGGYLLVE